MSFEPDPDVSNRIKGRAANLAELAIDLVDDAKQLSSDFVSTLNDLRDICEPTDFVALVIEHLPANMQDTLNKSGLDMSRMIEMIDSLKDDGVSKPEIRARIVNDMNQNADPHAAFGFRMGARAGAEADAARHVMVHEARVTESPRSLRMAKLVDAMLAGDQGVVTEPGTGHKWLMCQLVLRSGYKAPGGIRKHETGLLQFAVEGKGPNGTVVQIDHYFDYEDVETLVIPRTGPAPRSIVTG